MQTAYADAFLGDILECPDDDAPRLIYADWLDENGEPERAELIRVQCDLATDLLDREQRAAALARERQLLDVWGPVWAAPLAPLVRSFEFRRGFVERVCLDSAALIEHGDEVFRLAPVSHLELIVQRGDSERVAECPHLARVLALGLNYPSLDARGVGTVLASPHLAGLRSLRLRVPAGALGPRVVQLVQRASRLAALDLGANHFSGPALHALLGSRWPELRTLHLNSAHLGDAEVVSLAASPLLEGLTNLDLSYNSIGQPGAAALALSPHAAGLRALWLGFNHLGDGGAQALVNGLFTLSRLYLGRNRLGLVGVRALASSPRLAELTHLDLDYNELPFGALHALATSPHLGRLEALYLRCGRGLTPRRRAVLERRFGASVCRF
jgi:uncharacterized protein (TIGR02996 family)